MKHLKYLFPLLLVTLFLSSCGEDDGPITPNTNPTSSIDNSAITISPRDSFTVFLTATAASTNPLNTLTVQKESVDLGLDVVWVQDAPIGGNPKVLFGDDKTSFNFKITVLTDLEQGQSADYQFVVTADNGDLTREIVTVTVPQPTTPPDITLTGDITEANDLYQVPIQVTKGDADLSTIAVYENGALAAANRLTLGAMSVWTDNPYTLGASMQGGINETLLMNIPTTSGNYSYMIIVTDAANLMDTLAYTLTLDLGTPVDSMKMDLRLLNAGGPQGQGAVNLITGESVGSDDPGAHLRDLGIDDSQPNATNWLQQIAKANATEELRIPSTAVDYASVANKEDIEAIYNAGTTIAQTDRLEGGEVLVLKTLSGAYVLVQIASVNVITDSNADYYSINAKF